MGCGGIQVSRSKLTLLIRTLQDPSRSECGGVKQRSQNLAFRVMSYNIHRKLHCKKHAVPGTRIGAEWSKIPQIR